MTVARADQQVDELERFIRTQRHRCYTVHRRRSDVVRMHPADYDALRASGRMSRYYGPDRWNVALIQGMEIVEDETCLDGPVVECASWWEHGRSAPRSDS